jgi:hypothetical protein
LRDTRCHPSHCRDLESISIDAAELFAERLDDFENLR